MLMVFIKINEGTWPLRVHSNLTLDEECWDQPSKIVKIHPDPRFLGPESSVK